APGSCLLRCESRPANSLAPLHLIHSSWQSSGLVRIVSHTNFTSSRTAFSKLCAQQCERYRCRCGAPAGNAAKTPSTSSADSCAKSQPAQVRPRSTFPPSLWIAHDLQPEPGGNTRYSNTRAAVSRNTIEPSKKPNFLSGLGAGKTLGSTYAIIVVQRTNGTIGVSPMLTLDEKPSAGFFSVAFRQDGPRSGYQRSHYDQ